MKGIKQRYLKQKWEKFPNKMGNLVKNDKKNGKNKSILAAVQVFGHS